ncbi:hypothetical protein Goklo_014285 [Gossypium klotzschianum]|uniref:RNase H type-1 domain-containing protein n=1 Tax=Gossypium klotzschianum TaxID=34286 RepID=A0A7J8U752_9ROSI|nr:hypothetical protein [Gossypium klotzschianum]
MGLHVGLTMVEIEGDALSMIQKLQTKGIAHMLNARAICEKYQACVFKHAQRQVNGVAHLLVVEGLKRNAKSYLIGEVLLFAKEAVDEDYRQQG